MDITPHVNLLRSLRGERTDYRTLIGEGVDNAFDAGADRVHVSIGDDAVVFQDDGVGITRDRIAKVFSLGDHGAMTTTQLGRFGVGIKSQAVNAGDVLRVVSKSKDGSVSVKVNWRQLLKAGQWQIDDPHWHPLSVDEPTGTVIAIEYLRHPPRLNLGTASSELAQWFYPAVADGKIITLNGEAVPLLAEPSMADIIERDISLSGGRSAHIRAGILTEPSKLNRVHVAFRHRVIMGPSTLGCGEYSGLTKMFARLSISGPWHLAKFKNDLTDEAEREELEEAVLEVLRPILEKCSSASLSARIAKVSNLVNQLVPEELSPSRPKRLKPEVVKEPSEKKRDREPGDVDADKAEPGGPAKSKRPRDSLLITFEGNAAEHGLGYFEPGKVKRVHLSKDDAFIAELIENRDEAFGARCLLFVALSIFEDGNQQVLEPELQFSSFGYRLAKHMSIQDTVAVAAA